MATNATPLMLTFAGTDELTLELPPTEGAHVITIDTTASEPTQLTLTLHTADGDDDSASYSAVHSLVDTRSGPLDDDRDAPTWSVAPTNADRHAFAITLFAATQPRETTGWVDGVHVDSTTGSIAVGRTGLTQRTNVPFTGVTLRCTPGATLTGTATVDRL